MNLLQVSVAKLFAVWRKTQLEDDINAELRFHLEMRIRENREQGMTLVDASLCAAKRFGNFYSIKDACRDVRGGGVFEAFLQDVGFAGRILRKDRAYIVIVVLALSLSIGFTAAISSVTNCILFRPLPYRQPEQLMTIWSRDNRHPENRSPFSYPDFKDLRDENQSFNGLGAFYSANFVISQDGDVPTWTHGARITSNIFPLLGVEPVVGRNFLESEDAPGTRVVVISHDLWQQRFHGHSDIVGASILLDAEKYRIIGVMPPGFHFPLENQSALLWTNMATDQEAQYNGAPPFATYRDYHYLSLLGRLKANATHSKAEASLRLGATKLAAQHPETNNQSHDSSVVPLLNDITDRARSPLLILLTAALCVLIIACANVANLRLARDTTRQREIAIRSALGAGSKRIFRQLLTENLLVTLVVGFFGLLISLIGSRFIVSILPAEFPRSIEVTSDFRTLFFSGILTLITSLLTGVVPAWYSARSNVAPLLNDCNRGCTETVKGRQLRNTLVVAELVLSFVLLTSTFLLTRYLWRLEHVDPGFNSKDLFTTNLSIPNENNLGALTRTENFYRELPTRVSTLHGIQSVAAISHLPLSGANSLLKFEIPGRSMKKSALSRAYLSVVTPNYFHTMQIPITKGRDFEEKDKRETRKIVIISESFVRKFFPNENPLGQIITSQMSDDIDGPTEKEIIGVVGDIKNRDLTEEDIPQIYLPYTQCIAPEMTLVIRTNLSPEKILPDLQNIVTNLDKTVPLFQTCLMSQYLSAAVAQPRLQMTIMAIFAIVTIGLTAIGVYAVMAFFAGQRQHEIGIRLALGAQKFVVFQLIMRQGIRLVGLALGLGVSSILLISSALRFFFGPVIRVEVDAIIWVALLLSGIALLACWLPAHRAANLNPLIATGQRPAG